ncbi:MAG TPA: hypothetical protein VG603_12025 [Chitinophagales bacterium]|nr:hypothetical protein [Chitinophagales bacterium]
MFAVPVVGTYCGIPQLTWWLDYHLFGFKEVFIPGTAGKPVGVTVPGFHATNLVFHSINTLLVFFIFIVTCTKLKLKPGNVYLIAFITAFIFAVHPQHVESVAWITERKDLTYTLFFLLAVYAYLTIADIFKRGIVVTLLFVLSLLSKGQAVSLVPAMLLFNYLLGKGIEWKLYGLLSAIAVIFGLIAIYGQQQQNAIYYTAINGEFITHGIYNSSYAFWGYLRRFVLPLNLSPIYPFPYKKYGRVDDNLLYLYPCFSLMAVAILWFQRHNKLLVFGSLFFLFNIVLLLQFIPVGVAIMADRYTYIAAIGPAFILGTAAGYLRNYWPKLFYVPLLFTGLLLLYLGHQQTKIWENDATLWRAAINQEQGIRKGYENLAVYYWENARQKDSTYFYT